jgi:hypothetical protein
MPDLTLNDFMRFHPGKTLDEALRGEARLFWGDEKPPRINPDSNFETQEEVVDEDS